MLGKLESIIFFVGDVEKSLEFYRDSLGLTLKAREGLDWVEFETNGAALILHRRVEQARPFHPELVFAVRDTDKTYERLREVGVKFLRPPLNQSSGHRSAFCTDPDGNVLKITSPIEGG
jgi:catechol 2,3-dioxygenase-like lactoylglutathione lyase family enzyme